MTDYEVASRHDVRLGHEAMEVAQTNWKPPQTPRIGRQLPLR
jgi:hypothetical protein